MTVAFDPTWGPFKNGVDAQARLCAFVDRACGPSVGVVWAANHSVFALRPPRRDGDGIGEIATFEWTLAPPPPPRPPHGFREKFIAFWNRYAQMQYESARIQAEGNIALGRAIGSGIDRMIHTHQDDGAGVALDILCVALSLALIPTGLGAVAVLGLIGGTLLLGADGVAYAKEIGGDEEGAEQTKRDTEGLRIIATVMTLPDFAYGGCKAIREFQEIRELRVLDRTTAAAAKSLATRTASAARAQRFAQIAERAHLRAQIRSQQIAAAIRLEFLPRGAASAATGLLIRDEIQSDSSALHQIGQRFRVHCVGARR